MKKKIINGILLVAFLFAASSAFVSCKDNDADVETRLEGEIAALTTQLQDLKNQVNNLNIPAAYNDTELRNRIAALETAVAALQGIDHSTYVTYAALPDKVKELLADYYTKAEVDQLLEAYAKKADIKEGLTEDQVKALIAAALADVKPGLSQDEVNALITAALADYAKKSDIPTIPAILTEAQVRAIITEMLAEYAKKSDLPNIPEILTKEQIIEIIKEQIKNVQVDVTVLFDTMVTSINTELVSNPLFGFNLPIDVKSNILLACFGEAKKDIKFTNPLTGETETVAYDGDMITNATGNAGKVYVTINPSSVDFTGKVLSLVNTAGEVAPVTLSGLQPSNKVVSFATRGDNAFYEAEAQIDAEGLKALEFRFDVDDPESIKETIKTSIRQRGKADMLQLAQTILNVFSENHMAAYRLQATWGEKNYHTYSAANIAAISYKPFTFDFDLNEIMDYNADNSTALENLEEYIVNHSTRNLTTRERIWNFLDRFNKWADKYLDNINWAIQPTLLIAEGDETVHPTVSNDPTVFTRIKAGEIKLMPTSWTAEIVAPAFKKFVAVIEIDGQKVSADDPINAGYLGQLIPGGVTEIPLTIEAGKVYKIQYTAMDYSGKVKNLYYTIRGSK